MTTLLIIIHVLVCLFLIGIVLLQHGKGADIGATFGGSSQSLFGSEGPVPLLNKITTFSAIVFMGTSVTLAYLSAHKSGGSLMTNMPAKEAAAPVKKEEPVTIPMPTTEQPPAEAPKAEAVPAAEVDNTSASAAQEEQAQVEPQPSEETVTPEMSAVQQTEAPAEQKPAAE